MHHKTIKFQYWEEKIRPVQPAVDDS